MVINNDQIDIIVLTWNSLNYLKCCLKSIDKYTKDISYRLIIVDNGSDDGTAEFLSSLKNKNILVKRNKKNVGAPRGWLQGYSLSLSEFVCLINDDVVVSPNWLVNLVKTMKENRDIGILGPIRPGASFVHPYTKTLSKIILEESKIKRKTPLSQLRFFTNNKNYEIFVEDYKKANKPILTRFNSIPHIISTCCALVRRRAVDKAGGLVDLRFTKYGGEDTDLSWRLVKSGYNLAITSRSYVHHFEHVSMVRNNVDRQKYLKINSHRFYKKWESDIKKYLSSKIKDGYTKHEILQESWLLSRFAEVVGTKFWDAV